MKILTALYRCRSLKNRQGRVLPAVHLTVLLPITLSVLCTLPLCGCADGVSLPTGQKAPVNDRTWTTAVTLQDEWTPAASPDGQPFTLPASEAVPVEVVLEQKEDRLDGYSSSEGGVGAEYALVSLREGPDAVETPADGREEAAQQLQTARAVIGEALEDLNDRIGEHVSRELTEGPDRHAAYQATRKEPSYIYLTSWISPQIARCDTQMLSYVLETYRYDRGFETDYYEVHGVTIDAQSGRRLSLEDLFSDLEPLPDLVWEALEINRRSGVTGSQKDAEIELLRAAIKGGRDDGSFAWMTYPEGLEFRIVLRTHGQPGSVDEKHQEYKAFVPFRLCEGILREQIAPVSYDHLYWYSRTDVKRIFGADVPTGMEGDGGDGGGNTPGGANGTAGTGDGSMEPAEAPHKPYTFYVGQVNGQAFLYGCYEGYTDVYRVETSGVTFVPVGSTPGEFYTVLSHNAYTMPDVQDLDLRCTMETIQELFLAGSAHLGGDGLPVLNSLFRIRGSQPVIGTGESFEAELFTDEEAAESSLGTVAPYASLDLCRTDGRSFLDAYVHDNVLPEDTICRLYIGGSEEDGWTVNGRPMEEVIGHMGYFEE